MGTPGTQPGHQLQWHGRGKPLRPLPEELLASDLWTPLTSIGPGLSPVCNRKKRHECSPALKTLILWAGAASFCPPLFLLHFPLGVPWLPLLVPLSKMVTSIGARGNGLSCVPSAKARCLYALEADKLQHPPGQGMLPSIRTWCWVQHPLRVTRVSLCLW